MRSAIVPLSMTKKCSNNKIHLQPQIWVLDINSYIEA